MEFTTVEIGGKPLRAPAGSPSARLLQDLAEGIPQARDEVQSLLEYLSSYKFEAEPWVNVEFRRPAQRSLN